MIIYLYKLKSKETVLSAYESMYPIEGEKYLFFDEIQYTDDWELWMKVIYDSRKDIRMVATGSASPILEKGAADSGTGRWNVLKIPTMSFYEYCKMLGLEDPLSTDTVQPCEILCEVKYRNNSHIPASDAIVELCRDKTTKVTHAFLVTKEMHDFGITKHETATPIVRVPAIAFLYLLGKAEADSKINGAV